MKIIKPKFNLAYYKDKTPNLGDRHRLSGIYTEPDGTLVQVFVSQGENTVQKIKPRSFTIEMKDYYKNSNMLKQEWTLLLSLSSDVRVGIWREYDEDGNITKETDENKKFGNIQPKDILEWMDKQGFINLKTGKGQYMSFSGVALYDIGFVEAKEEKKLFSMRQPAYWVVTRNGNLENFYEYISYLVNADNGKLIKVLKETRPMLD